MPESTLKLPWEGDGLVARALLAYARGTPNHPFKLRVFRALARSLTPKGVALRDECGTKFLVDASDYIGHSICFTGSYEPLSVGLSKRLMTGGGTFLDVGSNVGLFTCAVGSLPTVRCISVEAAATAFSKLLENLARNPHLLVAAVNVALAPHRTLVRLDKPSSGNLGTARIAGAMDEREFGGHVVAAIPLDELLDQAKVESIRLMKIDVEGFEPEVFEGLNFNASYRPENIVMEWVEDPRAGRDNLRRSFYMLSENGYQPFAVTGERFADAHSLPEENVWWRSC